LDEWTTITTPEGERKVRVPLEDQKRSFRNISRQVMSEHLENALPEERHRTYRRYKVRVVAKPDGSVYMSGALGGELLFGTPETSSP
jgi:hypothetical protein